MTNAGPSTGDGARIGDEADPARPSSDRARVRAVVVAVVVIIGSWLLVTPPNAGPDEAGHLVRAVAVIDGEPGSAGVRGPSWIVFPDISCYALYSDRPASCAPVGDEPDADAVLLTRAWDYPIWGHVLPGLALQVSTAPASPYLPRVASALLPAALVIAGLLTARRRSRVAGALAMLAVTPMAWFTFAVVNPSGPAIGGAFAVWTVMLFAPWSARGAPSETGWARRHEWIFAVGLAAAMLPRRDSVFWAAAVLVAASVATDTSVLDRLRHLTRGPASTLTLAVVAAAWWAVDNGTQTLGLFALSIGLVAAHDVWRRVRATGGRNRTRLIDGAAIAGLVVTAVGLAVTRDGGYDGELMRTIVGESGPNLLEAVGAVGTLDARIPLWVLAIYGAAIVAVGVLSIATASSAPASAGTASAGTLSAGTVSAGTSSTSGPVERPRTRAVWTGVAVLGSAVAAAWVLEMARGNTTGTYWQGRYSLPLLMGVPMLMGLPIAADRRWLAGRNSAVATAVVGVASFVAVVVFVVAVRRWGVGTTGSWDPRDWDTYQAPVPTTVLVIVHSGAVVGLGWALATGRAPAGGRATTPRPTGPTGATVAADVDR